MRVADSSLLAWTLLIRLVTDYPPPSPQFDIPKPHRGAPTKWNRARDIMLVMAVTEHVAEGENIDDACRALLKTPLWHDWSAGEARSRRLKPESLKRRYHALLRQDPDIARATNLDVFEALTRSTPSTLARRVR